METSAGVGGSSRRVRVWVPLAGTMFLLATTFTLAAAVPASAAGCVPGPHADLAGCNLADADLYGVNLTGANLTRATLTGANLTNATLTHAILTHASAAGVDLQGALISGATLTGASLDNALLNGAILEHSGISGAKFTGSDFTGVVSGGDSGRGTLPSNWSLVGGYLIGPGADLANDALAGANLVGNLTGANLTGADLAGAHLAGARLTGVVSGGLVGMPTLPAHWSVDSGYLVGPGAFLYGADLAGADLTGADAAGANLEGAVLTGADLTDADLANVDAIEATFSGTDLAGTDLAGANLGDVASGGITGTPAALPTASPANWQIVDGYLVGPFADLADAEMAGAVLPDSNLHGANLTGADLTGSNLTDSYVTYTNLTGTDLTDATLSGVTSLDIEGTPAALPPGWVLVNGVLMLTSIPLSGHATPGITPGIAARRAVGSDSGSAPDSDSDSAPGSAPDADSGSAPDAGSGSDVGSGSGSAAAPAAGSTRQADSASAPAAPRTGSSPRQAGSPPAVTVPQHGIDVYALDTCASAGLWQQNAVNEMRGIKSLGANSVSIAFPFYVAGPTANSVIATGLCSEPGASPVPLQSPSPARLAVLVHAAQSVGLQVMVRPLMDQSNLQIFDTWRGGIAPTNTAAWFASYKTALKPYLQMAQANDVPLFSISSELTSMSTSAQWPSAIAYALKLYSGQVAFDSSWNADPNRGDVHPGTAVAQDAYPLLANLTPTATVAQILAAWNRYLTVKPLPAAAGRVAFDEVGISADDGAYATPNYSPPFAVFNQRIQANWFTAACQFAKAHKMQGLYFWGPELSYNVGKLSTQPDPAHAAELQPAGQAAIRTCFE